ncbi:MAG: site-specific DNA-methyltransferase, partial [Salinispira sp.]
MISRDDARKSGFEVRDSSLKLPHEQAERVRRIKSILPGLVNSDGLVDVSALRDLLGIENSASFSQGYSLNFAGKGLAKIKADEPTKKSLKAEEAQSKNFDSAGNVIIRGDNLDVLKILRQNYTGKIKMIYIDPPYNTGSANFVYADNFRVREAELIERFGIDEEAIDFFENMFGALTHSGWLFAMYPRLKLARDLLAEDGVIFISIDDTEQANLKLLCDEIFGESNFIANIIWRKKAGGGQDSEYFAREHEYVLCYRKGNGFYMNFRARHIEERDYRKIKNGRKCRFLKLEKWGANALRSDRPTMYYAIKDPHGNNFYPTAPNG